MITVLLTTLETEMSTKAVDQGHVLADQITKIVSKVHQSVGAQETTDEIESDVAYRYIQYLEDRGVLHKELMPCERRKWADFLMMLPYSKRSPEYSKKILADLDAFLRKPLLEILGI